MNYQRIETTEGTWIVDVTETTPIFLKGWEVNRDGERTNRFRMIEWSAIKSQTDMRMNLHYGSLEVAR